LRRPAPAAAPPAPFSYLARTHALALAGDALITMALAGSLFFSISPAAARGRVMLSLLITMAPFAIVAPFLGPAIDRSRRGRRTMVVVSMLGRVATALVMAGVIDSLLLFPAAFTSLVLSKAYSVAKSALVPSAVDSEHALVEANSKLSIVGVIAGFVAAVPGVIILRFAGAEWVLRLAAVVFIVGALVSRRVVETREQPRDQKAGDAEIRSATIVAGAVAMALLRAVVGFVTFLVAFGFRRSGAPSWWFGVVLATSMAGTFTGAAAAPRLRSYIREERILLASLLVVAAVAFATARVDGRLWSAAVTAAVGLGAGAAKVAFDAIVQRDAPDAVRGRSFARFEAGFQLVWVVGALLPVVVATPLSQGYDVVGIATLAAAVAYGLTPRILTNLRQ
jgi:hypothetical protein